MIIDLRPEYDYANSHDESLTILAYFMGRLIIKDSVDRLYYQEVPPDRINYGDMLNLTLVDPIEKLTKQEQADIREFLAENNINLE